MNPVALALHDCRHDVRTFLGLAMALAAVLTPLLILLALRAGVVDALFDRLRGTPAFVEITFEADQRIAPDRLATIERMDGVAFVAAQYRSISATVELTTDDLRSATGALRASGEGDPYLADLPAPGPGQIVISRQIARDTGVGVGAALTLYLENRSTGAAYAFPMEVLGISPLLTARFALVADIYARAADAVATGVAVPELNIAGRDASAEQSDVSRLRLFATDVEQVGPVSDALRRMGFAVSSEDAQIASILSTQRHTRLVVAFIAVLSSAGFLLGFAMSVAVNIDKKRRSLAMLSLMGIPGWSLIAFPVVQGVVVALGGLALSFGLFAISSAVLGAVLAGALPAGARIAALPTGLALAVAVATVGASALAAALAGRRVIALDPKEAMRDG